MWQGAEPAGSTTTQRDVFGKPWFRAMHALYGLLGTTAAFGIATLPFSAAVFVSPLVPIGGQFLLLIGGFSIGPAWVAALYTMRGYTESRDIEPFRLFLRGYRLGWRQSLLFWAPYFALLFVLAFDLTSGLPAPVSWLLIALGAAAVLWGSTVLVIVAFFSFRLRDVMRLAVYALTRNPRWLLAAAALTAAAGGLMYLGSEVAAGILVAPFALLTVFASRPLVRRLTEEFTS
ncbi:YesL family protein [Humibacter ginsengisoli]